MTDEPVLSKWDFIAKWLKELNAPKKVVNAAIEIDDALINLDLGHNTEEWIEYYDTISGWDRTRFDLLFDLVMDDKYCTACEDCGHICIHCKLGHDGGCTPRHKHADEYFTIVRRWTRKQFEKDI